MPDSSPVEALTTVFNCIGAATKAFSGIEEVVAFLNGNDGNQAVLNAIASLQSELSTGFEELTAAINDATLQSQWASYAGPLSTIQQSNAKIAQELGTLSGSGSTYTVVDAGTGVAIPVAVWAAGGTFNGTQYESAISTLYSSATSLYNLFQVQGAGTPSILAIWNQLYGLRANNVVQDFGGQTSLSAYYMLSNQIYGILSHIFFMHEIIRALYFNLTKENFGVSMGGPTGIVATNFGNFADANSVWSKFGAAMANWPPILQDLNVVATSGDDDTGQDSVGGALWREGEGVRFWNQWTTTASYPQHPNAFFTGLQLGWDGPTDDSGWANVYLTGTLSTMGPGGVIQSCQQNVTSYSVGTPSGDYGIINVPYREGNPGGVISFPYPATYAALAYSVSPVPPPTTGTVYNVVTGFCFAVVNGNCLTIQLQYGHLDLTNPATPTVTVVGNAAPPVGQAIPLNPGTHTTVDLRPSATTGFPIDNVSLVMTAPTGTAGGRLGLLVRTGWPVLWASGLNPASTLAPYGFTPPGP